MSGAAHYHHKVLLPGSLLEVRPAEPGEKIDEQHLVDQGLSQEDIAAVRDEQERVNKGHEGILKHLRQQEVYDAYSQEVNVLNTAIAYINIGYTEEGYVLFLSVAENKDCYLALRKIAYDRLTYIAQEEGLEEKAKLYASQAAALEGRLCSKDLTAALEDLHI